LAGIRAQKDNLLHSASKAMRRALFGESGYGLDALGTEAAIQKLQPGDLSSLHQELVRPNNCVLAIYGDVDAIAVRSDTLQTFAAWRSSARAALAGRPFMPSPLNSIKRVVETRDKKQAVLVLGFPGTRLFDPERYPLELIQEACSDLGSRLFLRIREKLGLAYYVGAQNFVGLCPGYFSFYAGTMPEKAALVEQEMLREIELLRAEGLTEEELKRAKSKIIGQKKISRQDLGSYAMTTALDELYGLGHAYSDTEDGLYEAVTVEQTRGAARKFLNQKTFVLALVKPA
jgi:zinc protease